MTVTAPPAGPRPGPAATARYQGTFGGRPEEARRVRREITGFLAGCPVTADMVLIASELAANAILHTRSRGQDFGVRCELAPGTARVEVEGRGGPWRPGQPDGRPHGLDIVRALAGPGGWGTRPAGGGGRIVWAQLSWNAGRRRTIPAGQSAVAGANIRALRQRNGWTQAGLGQLMGWPATSAASIVCAAEGRRYHRQRGFTAAEIEQLAVIFGVPAARLTTGCVTCGGDPPAGYACLTCGATPAPGRPPAVPARDHAGACR